MTDAGEEPRDEVPRERGELGVFNDEDKESDLGGMDEEVFCSFGVVGAAWEFWRMCWEN